jgi:hypothetical protein
MVLDEKERGESSVEAILYTFFMHGLPRGETSSSDEIELAFSRRD